MFISIWFCSGFVLVCVGTSAGLCSIVSGLVLICVQ